MMADITVKYPHTHKSLLQARETIGYKQHIITTGNIEYDKSYLNDISEDLIEKFIDYQTRYPSKINQCIALLMHSVELLENEHNLQEYSGYPINKNVINYREQKTREIMHKIHEILQWEYYILMEISLSDRTQSQQLEYTIQLWIRFIRSQTPLNKVLDRL